MNNTGTKTLAARVPLDFYIKVLQEAAGLKMSVSDYLIYKLTGGGLSESPGEVVYVEVESAETLLELKAVRQDLRNEKREKRTLADEFKRIKDELEEQKRINNIQNLRYG
ncbi:MAG: hypothetical protein FJX80_15505 [Bacteroidetes bacterium]|nr:hypothetical protein [Bacteroidota bacterium]